MTLTGLVGLLGGFWTLLLLGVAASRGPVFSALLLTGVSLALGLAGMVLSRSACLGSPAAGVVQDTPGVRRIGNGRVVRRHPDHVPAWRSNLSPRRFRWTD
jgi:hypothetical protein